VRVWGPRNTTILLDPVDFIWNTVPVNHTSGDYRNGQKGVTDGVSYLLTNEAHITTRKKHTKIIIIILIIIKIINE
jgi:hypothetical protein